MRTRTFRTIAGSALAATLAAHTAHAQAPATA
jgi:hypothetical protein